MNKEFKQALDAARESLPTMSQGFMSTQSCQEAREMCVLPVGEKTRQSRLKIPWRQEVCRHGANMAKG